MALRDRAGRLGGVVGLASLDAAIACYDQALLNAAGRWPR